MAKVLLIIAQKDFREDELFTIKQHLEENGIQTETASITTDTAKGILGKEVIPDISLEDVDPTDYEYVIIIGGPGALNLARYHIVFGIIKKAKNVGAICFGSAILAMAGALNGKEGTVYETPDTLKLFKNVGCRYIEEDVVIDGKTITGSGPDASKEFARKLVKLIIN